MDEHKEIVTAASDDFADLGEGPFWEPTSQELLYVDLFVGDLCRLNPSTKKTEKIHFDKSVSFVIPTSLNPRKMVISVGGEIRLLDWESKKSRLLGNPEKDISINRFNDAKCDAHGRLWAGTWAGDVDILKSGSLWCLDPETQETKQHLQNLDLPNGIAWSLDNKQMYFVDSKPGRIYVFDYDIKRGTPRNQRVLLDFKNNSGLSDAGFPDGITMDSEGMLWVACYGGGRVIRVHSENGSVLRTVFIPAARVTSVAWGGTSYEDLYVTTAKRKNTREQIQQYPLAGAVFKVQGLGVKGLPAATFHTPPNQQQD